MRYRNIVLAIIAISSIVASSCLEPLYVDPDSGHDNPNLRGWNITASNNITAFNNLTVGNRLYLSRDPLGAYEAATKNYVDAHLGGGGGLGGAGIAGRIAQWTGVATLGNATNTDIQVAAAVAASHTQSHVITSITDHTSTATPGRILQADANGLPVNASNTDAQVAAAVIALHTQSHSITSILDHTSTATANTVLMANANGLPVNSMITQDAGATKATVGGILKATSENITTTLSVGGTITAAGGIDMASKQINNLATPTLPHDAATKAYADSVGGGGNVSTAGGTASRLSKFTAATTIGNSVVSDNGTGGISIAGTVSSSGAATFGSNVNVSGNIGITGTVDGVDVSTLASSSHAQQHSITSTTDHTSTATPNTILKANANGLPVNSIATDNTTGVNIGGKVHVTNTSNFANNVNVAGTITASGGSNAATYSGVTQADIQLIDDTDFVSAISRRGEFYQTWFSPGMYDITKVLTGDFNSAGSYIELFTGTTANSSVVTTNDTIGMIGNGKRTIDWAKRQIFIFSIIRINSDAQFYGEWQIRPTKAVGILNEAGIGIQCRNLALYSDTYGTASGNASLGVSLADSQWAEIMIIHTPATPKIEYYVNGTLRYTETTSNKIPQAATTGNTYVRSAKNGAAGGTNCYWEMGTEKWWRSKT